MFQNVYLTVNLAFKSICPWAEPTRTLSAKFKYTFEALNCQEIVCFIRH